MLKPPYLIKSKYNLGSHNGSLKKYSGRQQCMLTYIDVKLKHLNLESLCENLQKTLGPAFIRMKKKSYPREVGELTVLQHSHTHVDELCYIQYIIVFYFFLSCCTLLSPAIYLSFKS